jgi:hypothetical protein
VSDLKKGKKYQFGAFESNQFRVIAVTKEEAWVEWLETGKTEIIPVKKHGLTEVVEDETIYI